MSEFLGAGLKVRIARDELNWNDLVSLLFYVRYPDGGVAVAQPLTLVPHAEGQAYEPTVRLEREIAQVMIDRLWDCGLRPSEGTGSAGSLAATQKHLEDMRAIAFAKSGVVKP
jgi:hypothetical protein